jgi:hypothetical protein
VLSMTDALRIWQWRSDTASVSGETCMCCVQVSTDALFTKRNTYQLVPKSKRFYIPCSTAGR